MQVTSQPHCRSQGRPLQRSQGRPLQVPCTWDAINSHTRLWALSNGSALALDTGSGLR